VRRENISPHISVLPTSNAITDTYQINTSHIETTFNFKRLKWKNTSQIVVFLSHLQRRVENIRRYILSLVSIHLILHKNVTFGILLQVFYILNLGYYPKN